MSVEDVVIEGPLVKEKSEESCQEQVTQTPISTFTHTLTS